MSGDPEGPRAEALLVGVTQYELNQLLALEKTLPVIVALSFRDHEFHAAPKRLVALVDFSRIGCKRYDFVFIPVDCKKRNLCRGQGREPVDRIVFGKFLGEFFSRHFVRPCCLRDSGVTGYVAHRIDARKTPDLFRIFGGPAQRHKPAPAAPQ